MSRHATARPADSTVGGGSLIIGGCSERREGDALSRGLWASFGCVVLVAIEANKFCMEQQAPTRRDLEAILGRRAPRRGTEPEARSLDRHDQAVARSARNFRGRADPPSAEERRLRMPSRHRSAK